MGKVKDESTCEMFQRTLKDIQYTKDISDSAVMIIYGEVRLNWIIYSLMIEEDSNPKSKF